ncbi:MAG: DUF5688 family protein [Firmicutes bacterium]|nr:DUF5688 family protein [Bacillota bacterium]MDD7602394.1 DUF5688 family protein [Bacillota bacterium]MDY5856570.1 DUF5688 family protein [Anaerovoracaceae bacterium]
MNYERFKRKMAEQILEFLPEEKKNWTVRMEKVTKVNRVLDGMVLMPPQNGQDAVPGLTFYMEEYYEMFRKGKPLEEILQYIADLTEECVPPPQICSFMKEIRTMRHQIVMELVHKERNQQMLRTMPHRDFLDLAVIYRILFFDEKRGYFSGAVTNEIMKELEMTEEELYRTAQDYMPEELPFTVENFGNRVLLLSNCQKMYGASVLLYPQVLDSACEVLGGNLYITPVSGDQVGAELENPEILQERQDQIWNLYHKDDDPEDLLSDQIYLYRWHSGQVVPAADEEGGMIQ